MKTNDALTAYANFVQPSRRQVQRVASPDGGESAAKNGVATPQLIRVNYLCPVEYFKDAATGK